MFRILIFTATPEELDNLGWAHLAIGLPIVWIVGYGRWWDEPRDISFLHRIGVGSVVYVLVLATFLWIVGLPLARRSFGLGKVMAFVAFTGLPAALYAIPVEIFASEAASVQLNIAFLAVVSLYRVSLLLWFYRRGAGMSFDDAGLAGLTPLGVIALGLVFFGLAEGILDIMGGLRQSGMVQAYEIVSFVSIFTIYTTPLLLSAYVWAIVRRRRQQT